MNAENLNPNTGSESASSDWDILAEMSKTEDESRWGHGSSEQFKQQAKMHRENAEKFYAKATTEQKKKLEQDYGIRDASDAGEFLHEKASWKEQVKQETEIYSRELDRINQKISQEAQNAGIDPITGEQTGADFRTKIPEEQWARFAQKIFLNRQEEILPDEKDIDVLGAVSEIILNELGVEKQKNDKEEIKPKSAAALKKEATEKWIADIMSDENKLKELQNSPAYVIMKRRTEKELNKEQ